MGAQHIFWGKYQATGDYLPLEGHCIDVAMVFRQLCALSPYSRVFRCILQCDVSETFLDRLAFLAALHDIGKANWGFQFRVSFPHGPRYGHIGELGPLLDAERAKPELLERLLQVLPDGFPEWFESESCAVDFLEATFSHQGLPIEFEGMPVRPDLIDAWLPRDYGDPFDAVARVIEAASTVFPRANARDERPIPETPELQHRFAGLLMLADWIGSHEAWFPIEATPIQARVERNRRMIPALLRNLGLDATSYLRLAGLISPRFVDRFGRSPRPLQAAISALDPGDARTRLVIAESETGSGKTEAALDWFLTLFAKGRVDGLCFALPTRVAARELYERVVRYIAGWFPPDARPAVVLAVPGYARVDGKAPLGSHALPPHRARPWDSEQPESQVERLWSAERPKRFLAATIAVGTIDQALLSVIQTRHAHLRSACLDRSLLVVDEVHASDEYMTELLTALLNHHLRVGGSAMLLSATLGARSRARLASDSLSTHRSVPPLPEAISAPYPSITLADGVVRPVAGTGRSKLVSLTFLPEMFALERVVGTIKNALRHRARVLVILNTVDRAVRLLRACEADGDIPSAALFSCSGNVAAHHGRFAPADRETLDRAVSERFGPGTPDGPVVLIGTQTLEQSLDIDADLLITDLAPADVLLQRLGRLHRHERARPTEIGNGLAPCVVLTPDAPLETLLDDNGRMSAEGAAAGLGSVYENVAMLELTLQSLMRDEPIRLPEENRRIVESVTHPQALGRLDSAKWRAHRNALEGRALSQRVSAHYVTVQYDKPFCHPFADLGQRVTTRLGADTFTVRLDAGFQSPFGQHIEEMLVPAHLAPDDPPDTMCVLAAGRDCADLVWGERRYRYSRYGLEALRQL